LLIAHDRVHRVCGVCRYVSGSDGDLELELDEEGFGVMKVRERLPLLHVVRPSPNKQKTAQHNIDVLGAYAMTRPHTEVDAHFPVHVHRLRVRVCFVRDPTLDAPRRPPRDGCLLLSLKLRPTHRRACCNPSPPRPTMAAQHLGVTLTTRPSCASRREGACQDGRRRALL